MIWDKANELISRIDLEAKQLKGLQETARRVYDKVPFYRDAFDRAGVKPTDIKSLKDIQKLPFTTKNDLRANYPYGLFAVPMREIVRVHASSGTTGKPVVVGYTKKDLDTWSDIMARVVSQAGVTADDIVQVAFGYGLFTGGFGLHYGLEKVGATVVPASSGNTEKQIMLMEDFGTTVLVSTPSYALYLAEVAHKMGKDPKSLKVRLGLFGAEPWTEGMRRELEERWGIKATDNYGLSEIIGPGVAGECIGGSNGLHINEDHFIPEVIDPETGASLGFDQEGELVFTTITKEGFPVIRFRTKDLSIVTAEPCACGRTLARMRRVSGRADDMLIIRGVNIFPSQIESVLMSIEGVEPHYEILVSKRGFLDDLEIKVEVEQSKFTDPFQELGQLERHIAQKLQSALTITPRLKLVEPGAIERSTGKARRVTDLR